MDFIILVKWIKLDCEVILVAGYSLLILNFFDSSKNI